jgi:hypothetical protein
MEAFHGEMVKAGLTSMEARALLNTWYTGYFVEAGLKVFWILPRAQVDGILPLEIKPAPDKVERVIVGRSEILTPEFEAKLRRVRKHDSLEILYKNHKYYLAYQDFLRKDGLTPSALASGSAARSSWLRSGQAGWATPWFSKGNRHAAGTSDQTRFDISGRAFGPVHPSGK